MDPMIEHTATRIFTELAADPVALNDTLHESGLARLWCTPEQDGFDLPIEDGMGLLHLAGLYAAPAPIAETLLATWILRPMEVSLPEGSLSVCLQGYQSGLSFGDIADHVLSIREEQIELYKIRAEKVDFSLGDDPIIAVDEAFSQSPIWQRKLPYSVSAIVSMAALIRSAQICGALDRVLDMTVAFAKEREQFGRPLTKFQAIQHLLSEIAAETAAANAALQNAYADLTLDEPPNEKAAAIAKYRACKAATIVTAHAHQVHGAIGYTREYELSRYSRRLWQWRDDFGDETVWSTWLGAHSCRQSTSIWKQISEKHI